MSDQKKNKESMICITPKTSQNFLVHPNTKQKHFFTEKELFKEKGAWRIEKKTEKKAF